jgi:hypothetical protein
MEDLDNHHYKLQESLDDMIRLRQVVSNKDTIIKDLCAPTVGVLGPTAHPGLPLKVLFGVGRCYRL